MQLVAADTHRHHMTYGSCLERRKFGIYYFRQTAEVNGKQVVRRVSLRTADVHIAKLLALQMKARAAMVDPHGVRKYEVEWDENNNLKKVKVTDATDARNLAELLTLTELHRAEKHKRELAAKRVEADIAARQQEAFASSKEGKDLLALHERLLALPEKSLSPQSAAGSASTPVATGANAEKLTALLTTYLADVSVKSGTLGKYRRLVERLIAFGETRGVTTSDGLTRKFITAFRLHLKNDENKSPDTIRNMFYTLSSFYNWLLSTGEVTANNPFVGHRLKSEDDDEISDVDENTSGNESSEREPFTLEELEKIFLSERILKDPTLFFICLILLTSGARPNEICQLWTDDFKFDSGTPELRITANKARDQSLKNKHSKRTIYLHELVVQAGIQKYLSGKNLGMAFGLKRPKDKTYSTYISEEFSDILRKLAIPKKTMYCFRHTANTRMKHAGVNQEVREDLVGHLGKGVNARTYSGDHFPTYLAQHTAGPLFYSDVAAIGVAVTSEAWLKG